MALRTLTHGFLPLLCMVARTGSQIPEVGYEGYSANYEHRQHGNDIAEHPFILA
jgi:hypothetical protein